MTVHAHVSHAPPAQSEEELATARWEDDGGPIAPSRPHAGQWLRIAAGLAERLPELTGREDLLVTCCHSTRSGAPAAFYPALAHMEIDTALFAPHCPTTINPTRPGDEERYPTAWGAVTHEAAHAAHTRWAPPPALAGTAVDRAAALLEESRAERAHLRRRPADRRFLRTAVHTLILQDITHGTPSDPWHAAHVAALILARRDAGILDPDETEPVHATVAAILGEDLLSTLATIWTAAHHTADEDGQAMLAHADAWCRALDTNPGQSRPAPDSAAPAGELAKLVGEVTSRVQVNEASQRAAHARAAAMREARARERAERTARAQHAADIAAKVFARRARPYSPNSSTGPSPVTGTRTPTTAERAAAGRLARSLRTAAHRERTATRTASIVPPGRLNMRQALARDAQRAAGATPTATPWIRTTRRHIPNPPLHVGIAVDVSGSMWPASGPLASAAWILAQAVTLTDAASRSATVAYDEAVTAITAPGRTPRRVTEFQAQGGGHSLAEAIDALDAGLGLTHATDAGRLLVIASDGDYAPCEADAAATRTTALHATGCAILWLAFAPDPRPLPHATLVELTDPHTTAAEIGTAATRALAAT